MIGAIAGDIIGSVYEWHNIKTKKFLNNRNDSFYKPDEYRAIYQEEISKLKRLIEASPEKKFLIAKIGGRYANRFRIFNEVIGPQIKEDLKAYNNVTFLW